MPALRAALLTALIGFCAGTGVQAAESNPSHEVLLTQQVGAMRGRIWGARWGKDGKDCAVKRTEPDQAEKWVGAAPENCLELAKKISRDEKALRAENPAPGTPIRFATGTPQGFLKTGDLRIPVSLISFGEDPEAKAPTASRLAQAVREAVAKGMGPEIPVVREE